MLPHYTNGISWGLLVITTFIISSVNPVSGQISFQNTPPVINVDRNWRLSENEPIGSMVTRVRAEDAENDILEFGLEPTTIFNGPSLPAKSSQSSGKSKMPFRIDPNTGVVHLNESLSGRGGESFFLFVTVFDGQLTAKTEVYVNVFPKNATNIYSSRTPSFTQQAKNISQLLPPFHLLPAVQQRPSQNLPPQLPPLSPGSLPGFGGNSNIYTAYNIGSPFYMSPGNNTSGSWDDGNSVPSKGSPTDTSHQQPQRPLPDPASGGEGGGSTTLLKVVSDRDGSTTRPGSGNGYGATIKNPNGPTLVGGGNVISSGSGADADGSSNINGGNNTPTITSKGNQVEKTQETAYTVKAIIPVIITICGIFLAAGIIAMFIYRKHLCAIGKSLKKKSKEEMTKKSNQSNISSNITEDSRNSMVMQHWNGPMAFNNRYVPWERDNQQHAIATSQLSTSSSTGNSQTKTDRWEFPRHRLKFFNILGEGAFGQVWRCEATDIDGNEGITTVAVKTLKENATEVERNDLYSELQVMKSLEPHVNVVRLLGCCTEKDPIFVVIEYVNRGKLQTYLRSSRAERHYGNTHGKSNILTSGDLTSFMYQVARGMDFLTSRGIIHRDLAARNILITDDHTCKVADFGFARDVITSMVYERKSEGKLPIRWMAIESLYDNIFSVKSDIWSFGILMWEIVTLGSTPYPGISAADVMKKVRDGYRLEKPEHCRRELYNIMYYCWAKDSNERPSFSELVQLLDKLLLTEMDYIELERFPDHNYYNMLSLSGEKL